MKQEENTLSVQSILKYLPKSGREKMSKQIKIYDCLDSTNITAKNLALSGAMPGTVIIANSQTAGKGCHGKVFHSPPDHGIYISFVLDTEQLNYSTPPLITVSAAVSVCKAIEALTDKRPKVKWVNDILLDGKKICGILTESVISAQSHKIQCLILGIGINFDTPASEFPKELQQTAGSLFDTQPAPITRNQLAAEIINRILFTNTNYSAGYNS